MHIVFLVNIFPAKDGLSTGGSGNYVSNIAQELVRKGHKVSIITEADKNTSFYWHGIKIYRINATRGFRNTGRPMRTLSKLVKNLERSFFYNKEVLKIHKKHRVDLVQSVNTYGISLFRLKNIPYVVRVSDYPSLWSGANREQYLFEDCLKTRRIDEEIQFAALKKADAVITPSNFMGELIRNKTGRDTCMIESPVCTGDSRILMLNEDDLTVDCYWVTYGAMIYRKSILMLAGMIDTLLEEYPDMKYVMIGRDREVYYKGRFMMASALFCLNITKHKERFVFLGEISDRKRLFSIIKYARICILPTRIDNLPNTVLESMALGKIVISSDQTSVEQLITDGINGFLSPIDNAKELHRKIQHVMRLSGKERADIEKKAQDRVKELTPDKVYLKMMDVYTKTIKKFKGSH